MKISPLTVLKAGIPNYIIHLLGALADVDKNNEYVLYTNRPIPFDLGLPERFQTVTVTFPSPHLQFWYQIGLPMRMKSDGIQLFHDPVYPLPFVLPVPGVITVHDLSNYTNPGVHSFRSALSGRLFPAHLRKASQIMTDSFFTASELERLFPRAAGKINVIHLGISDRFRRITCKDTLESVGQTYDLPSRFLLFLGTLEPRKNIERLLEAYALSCSGIPHSLVITGGLGWKYDKLLKLISDHPNKNRIHLTGYVKDEHLPVLLSLAEFLVYPSTLEGFGLPILEAMACGTPVLTSNVSSMPEIAGDAAFLVDPLSVDSISNGINILSSNSELRSELSKKGLERAHSFSWRKTALKTLEVYEKALK
ncbi:MAG: glycosyltransferase family 4 protein [Candidatus Aegiribacteria sp.]|nr:glycosyltransferase family 4 protein [Candidatus Aegiribacteria sp.]